MSQEKSMHFVYMLEGAYEYVVSRGEALNDSNIAKLSAMYDTTLTDTHEAFLQDPEAKKILAKVEGLLAMRLH